MNKARSKPLAAAFTLIVFASASVYCTVEALAETLAQFTLSHHHEESVEPHEHSAPAASHGHHHGDPAAPETGDDGTDFCCSQLNGIISKPHNPIPLSQNITLAWGARVVQQAFNLDLFFARNWLLHDKAPPGPNVTLFVVLNSPPHAPPFSPSC